MSLESGRYMETVGFLSAKLDRKGSKKNITFAKGDTLILRADHTTKLSASGPGRDSFRLMSKKTYTNHVSV